MLEAPTAEAPQEVLDEVAREYEQSLDIPATKPAPQWMLMPVGLIGSGKTTITTLLSERLGLIRLCTDEVRKRLKARGYLHDNARHVTQALLEKYLNLGYSLAIDANTGSAVGLEHNQKSKRAFPQVRQIYIHIHPPETFILEHLQSESKTWLFTDARQAIEVFAKNKEKFTLPDLPFVYTFDPSRDDMPAQLDEAVIAIRDALSHKESA